jgi:beta-galactosidase/beta-glucuronidase
MIKHYLKINLIIASLSILIYPMSAQVSFGTPENINNSWKFVLADIKDGQDIVYNDSKWQSVDLPHDWSVKGRLNPNLASCTGYLPGGIGWYRKTINIPLEKQREKVYLYFEGVYNRSEVFINGQSLGKRPNGYISFMYDASPYIKFGQDNVIAVRVDHSQYADSRWYTGSGIYRNVWLVYANPVHIAQWGVYAYPEINGNHGTLHIEVGIENGSESQAGLSIINELFDPEGKEVIRSTQNLNIALEQSNKINVTLDVNEPQLWNIDNPILYKLKTTILKDGKIIDQTTTITGFRTYTFDPDRGFALNGEWMKVKGVCIHHDAGVLGAAIPREVWKRRLLTLKKIGVNAIRTSHNPQAPDLYELCDELGLLVLNEMYDEWVFPKRKWIEGWNVGTPGLQGSYDIFKEWGEKDLADFVRRDRNHLSVFAWSIGNEVDYPNDPYSHPILGGEKAGFTQALYGGYNSDAPDAMQLGDIAKRLVKVVKEYDKSRPATAGLAGVAMSNETEYPGALDIAGYNYTESIYDSDHKKYPDRVIYGSENRHDIEAWKAVRDKEFIFGQFLWTGIDYLGESGQWPSRGFYSGLLDFGGFIKPKGYFRQSLWSNKPMVYIGTYPAKKEDKWLSQDAWPIWNYEEGQLIRVVCYTNTAKARLLLNGKEVGQTKDYDDGTGIIYWDIPYQSGKLEVAGMDENNNQISDYYIQSSKQPYGMKIVQAETEISRNKGLSQIILQVVDEDGVPVMLSDNEVTCQIDGLAKLLGLEASNNSDMSDYTDNKHCVFHGRILAYIQATGKKGEIKVNFSSPLLKSQEITIHITD